MIVLQPHAARAVHVYFRAKRVMCDEPYTDVIDANKAHLSDEVWSWQYKDGSFEFIELGELPPPPGLSPTESDIRQLW